MTAMLAELLGTIADEIRAALPANLVPANDEDSQQLLRELSSAGLLDQADLIALLLRRADEERIANAIRARSNPRGGFLQALIADEDETISAAAMALILSRGRRRDRLGQPRIEFEDLPVSLARTLAYSVAAALRQHVPGLAAKDGHLPFGKAAAVLVQSRAEAKAIDRLTSSLVKILNQAGLLDERLLEAAADEGDVAFLAHASGRAGGNRWERSLGLSRRWRRWPARPPAEALGSFERVCGQASRTSRRPRRDCGPRHRDWSLRCPGRGASAIGQRVAASGSGVSRGTEDLGGRRWRRHPLIAAQ